MKILLLLLMIPACVDEPVRCSREWPLIKIQTTPRDGSLVRVACTVAGKVNAWIVPTEPSVIQLPGPPDGGCTFEVLGKIDPAHPPTITVEFVDPC